MSSAGVYFTNRAIPMSQTDLIRQKRIITASAVNPAKFPPRTQSVNTENNLLRKIACVSKNATLGFSSNCTNTQNSP